MTVTTVYRSQILQLAYNATETAMYKALVARQFNDYGRLWGDVQMLWNQFLEARREEGHDDGIR